MISFFLFFVSTSFAEPVSAYRPPHTHFQEIAERSVNLKSIDSAYALAAPVGEIDLSKIPTWSSFGQIEKAFKYVRDHRFLAMRSMPEFARRSTWMYPDDGCYARAALMVKNISSEITGEPLPAKIFAYGNLKVQTTHHPRGNVTWWYHVAPVIKDSQNTYVLDPALDAKRPLLLQEWLSVMHAKPESLRVSICDPHTYTPKSSCLKPGNADQQAELHQRNYLDNEWARVQKLLKDPTVVLGDHPEWE